MFTVKSGIDISSGKGEAQLHEFSSYYDYDDYSLRNLDYYNSSLKINFLTSGQKAGSFTWSDERSLVQIQQMTRYEIVPRGIVSLFKYGGFVVFENDEKCLVAGIVDLEESNYKVSYNACEELELNGYKDWTMPTLNELKVLKTFMKNQDEVIFGGLRLYNRRSVPRKKQFWPQQYWCNNIFTKEPGNVFYFGDHESEFFREGLESLVRVRPVRFFSKFADSTTSISVFFSGKWMLYTNLSNRGTADDQVRFEFKNGVLEGYEVDEEFDSEFKMKSVKIEGDKISFKILRSKFYLQRKDNNEVIGKADDKFDVIARPYFSSK